MKSEQFTQVSDKNTPLPVVHIDALNELFIQSMREFFFNNGCRIQLNKPISPQTTYHIIAGDFDFVKQIIGRTKNEVQKTLVLVWNTYDEDVRCFINNTTQIALVDTTPLQPDILNTILNFFFTGRTHVKNFMTTPMPPRAAKKIVPDIKHETPYTDKEDTQRIKRTISFEYPKKQKRQWGFFTTLGGILFILVLPIALCVFSAGVSGLFLYRASGCIRQGNAPCTERSSTEAENWVSRSAWAYQLVARPAGMVGFQKSLYPYELALHVLDKLTNIMRTTGEIAHESTGFASSFYETSVSTDSQSSTALAAEKMKSRLFSLRNDLDLTYLMMKEIEKVHVFPFSYPLIQTPIKKGGEYLSRLRSDMDTVEKLLMLYPYVAGYKKSMTFLVLLQNNAELRPTGGFIGSVMKTTITEGKVADMRVQDVYDLDGQLKGHVDPPEPIRTILAQEHWYLRDSNWNPDFRESAKRALWFYEKEGGTPVDGVIAVNASLISSLLAVTGPVDLTDLKETVSSDNFFSLSLAHTQTDFFPGSTKKKDFLGNLMTALTTKITAKTTSGTALFEILRTGLTSGDIQFYFQDAEPQLLVEKFRWAGAFPASTTCRESVSDVPCLFVFDAVNEANLGVNKANYFIRRQDKRDVTFEDNGTVSLVLTRTIANTSAGEPGSGVYRAYIQISVPSDARVTSFFVGGVPVPKKETTRRDPLQFPYGEISGDTSGLTPFFLALEVPPGKEETIRLEYNRAIPQFSADGKLNWDMVRQKQSGINNVPTIIRIRYPSIWKTRPVGETLPVLANEGYLEYNTFLRSNEQILTQFSK